MYRPNKYLEDLFFNQNDKNPTLLISEETVSRRLLEMGALGSQNKDDTIFFNGRKYSKKEFEKKLAAVLNVKSVNINLY